MGTIIDGKSGAFLINYAGALSDSAVQFFGPIIEEELDNKGGKNEVPE